VKILLTGASSFTGVWFARALAEAGHDVHATFRSGEDAYDGLRADRVRIAAGVTTPYFGLAFGDDGFVELLEREPFDVVCHHGAEVGDYRSPDFDVAAALARNTRQAGAVLRALHGWGGAFVLTGSVFEQDEGEGERPLRAFSPYGLSKGLTGAAFSYYADREGVQLGKFVIPNPFGPLEEPRFTSYLVRTWAAGETARVATPAYVRDNIHVSLLALAYAAFVERVAARSATRMAPSGYVESQGAFAQRFAAELGPRLGLETPLDLAEQVDFPEPRTRVNSDRADRLVTWDEGRAWDDLAAYYAGATAPAAAR
jgi:UDP-glucose 4-epimerase